MFFGRKIVFFPKNNDLEIKKTKSPPKFKISPGPLKKKILYKNIRFHALRLSPYIQRIKTKGLFGWWHFLVHCTVLVFTRLKHFPCYCSRRGRNVGFADSRASVRLW